jgi:hypothetical protein
MESARLEPADLAGIWGLDHGYEQNPHGVCISFAEDGTGIINPHTDGIPFGWKLSPEGLSLQFDDLWMGPYPIHIEDRKLPLGTFTSIVSRSALLPFGLNEFQLISREPYRK